MYINRCFLEIYAFNLALKREGFPKRLQKHDIYHVDYEESIAFMLIFFNIFAYCKY